jgi:ATP-dependent RNA helicase DeaD
VYLVHPRERVDALINVLLHHADEQTLVFARTRADVSEIARELQQAGFASGSLSGEMSQDARNRALSAFKRGDIRALIATDVAARGIDVQDIARVIQLDPPTDPDTYTHRSGRTGRAGRKGVSAVLVAPAGLRRAASLLQRAKVQYRIEPIPTAEAIRKTQDERWLAELTEGDEREIPERVQKQVARIVEGGLTERALAQLIINVRRATGEPREVTPLFPEPQRGGKQDYAPRFAERGPRANDRPARFDDRGPRQNDRGARPPSQFPERGPQFPERAPQSSRAESGSEQWVPFRVSWGEAHGADARRLVAMLCRRGNVRGTDIGAIRVGRTSSTVEVAASVARGFAESTREPDPRDPRVLVSPFSGVPTRENAEHEPEQPPQPQRARPHVPPSQHRPPRAFADARPMSPRARPMPPKPARDAVHSPARDMAPRPAREVASRPAREVASRPVREVASRPVRDLPPKPARESSSKTIHDVPPKRPARKIVVTAPPMRRGPKKK